MNRSIVAKLVYVLMGLQIVIGIVWMVLNFSEIPMFGDTGEYVELAETFKLDEYRPILFPLILREFLKLDGFMGLGYQSYLYMAQTVFCFLCILYFIFVITNLLDITFKRPVLSYLFIGLFLITVPSITFFNFSVLTDGLALSGLVLCLSALSYIIFKYKVSIVHYILMLAGLFLGALLRGDRLYISMVIGFVCIVILRVRKKPGWYKKTLALILCFGLLFSGVKAVNKRTQTPGINGRITTDFNFVLLDRIVWPNLSANYQYLPDNIKEVISYEEALKFEEHNNYVMYITAPLIESRIGNHELAGSIYKQMARTILKHDAKKVCLQVAEDIAAVAFTPVSSLLCGLGYCEKNDEYNNMRLSQRTPGLTIVYDRYFEGLFILLMILGIILCIKNKRSPGEMNLYMAPFIATCIIINLWFSVGDGAPPNDRYALIIYFTYAAFMAWAVLPEFNLKR